jgi:hypothetical protein
MTALAKTSGNLPVKERQNTDRAANVAPTQKDLYRPSSTHVHISTILEAKSDGAGDGQQQFSKTTDLLTRWERQVQLVVQEFLMLRR